jgi:hypothetical protein
LQRGVLISHERIFAGKFGLDNIASTPVSPDCTKIEVPCVRASRYFHRICELDGMAIFAEQAWC